MTDQEKQFYAVQKYFVSLQTKVKKFEMCGQNPPEYLLKNYEDAKREMNYLADALD